MKTLVSLILLFLLSATISFAAIQSPYKRLIIFGDSLSDVGTYSKVAAPKGGGKFTTNPGLIWADNVANDFGLPMKPNRYEGYGLTVQLVGGFNYAQGGARVALEQSKTGQAEPSARPLTVQIQYHLQLHRGFLPTDLVILQGGANDLFAQIQGIQKGKVAPVDAIKNMTEAGQQVVEITRKLRLSGARNLYVQNLPMIQATPFAFSQNAQVQALITQMVNAFNAQLVTTRAVGAKLIDIQGFEKAMANNYAKYGIKNVTHPACTVSSLLCNSQTLVEPGADKSYKFADAVHPATTYSILVGKFITSEILRTAR